MSRQALLSQYPTPMWVADELVARYFPSLDKSDVVLEPSCGAGNFLMAIPAHVQAVGVEIDSDLASIARNRTGREIITGDFRTVALDLQPTVVLGNPPFSTSTLDAFLNRSHALLPEGGRVGFLLSAFVLKTASRVVEYSDRWSIQQEMLPQTIYPRLHAPLIFAVFSKDRRRTLVGFALYSETRAVQMLKRRFRQLLEHGSENVGAWRAVVQSALVALGGEADLDQIYELVEGSRPTDNQWWKAKVRQEVQRIADRVGPGRWAQRSAA